MNRTLVSANMRATPADLPTTIGLVVALAGPFLVQFVVAPLLLQLGSSHHRGVARSGPAVAAERHRDRHYPPLAAPTAVLARDSSHRVAMGAAGGRAWRRARCRGSPVDDGREPAPAAIHRGTVASVTTSGPAWLLLVVVLTASVTEELLFRAYPIECLTRLTGSRWPGAVLSLAAFGAFHLLGWNVGHVVGVVLPLGAVMTGLYLWRRNLVFVIMTHVVLNLPIVLIALGVLPPL